MPAHLHNAGARPVEVLVLQGKPINEPVPTPLPIFPPPHSYPWLTPSPTSPAPPAPTLATLFVKKYGNEVAGGV